ncbi:unnamed protein product, partial [Didymodactylos carnosus]
CSFDQFPNELYYQILSYLNEFDLIRSLYGVGRRINQLIHTYPLEIELKENIDDKSINYYFNKIFQLFHNNIYSLIFSNEIQLKRFNRTSSGHYIQLKYLTIKCT